MITQKKIRNVAIIAHVDHGKTTLMDKLLKESGALGDKQFGHSRLMDAGDLEKERGITILSKTTTLFWKDYQFNMIDTPGHADFGGEVERILNMVDGVLLLVDAAEGPMPQTKYVLTKALQQNIDPIVVINKVDKPAQRANEVSEDIFELFMQLDAPDRHLDCPVLYASAKNGWATDDLDKQTDNMEVIFRTIADYIPAPKGDTNAPLQMLVTMIDSDPFLGPIVTGRLHNGTLKENQAIQAITADGKLLEQGRATKLFFYQGMEKNFVTEANTGSIISLSGLSKATVSHTITSLNCQEPLPTPPIDPPTLTMHFSINDSPLAGKDGDKMSSLFLRNRLMKEAACNVSIDITQMKGEGFQVAGRGELQLGILIETMRREGFELSISPPQVIYKKGEKGEQLEPIENVQIDLEEAYLGKIMEKISQKHAQVHDVSPLGYNRFRMQLDAPTRTLIGFNSQLLMHTRGTATMHRTFKGYEKHRGPLHTIRNGALTSMTKGKATAYALMSIEARGTLFISAGDEVYPGMIIGEHSRENDLSVNPIKGKKLTNMRAAGSDKDVRLAPPRQMTVEEALSFVRDGEKVEFTPNIIRLRKQ